MLLEDPQQSDRSLCVVRMTKVGVLSIQPWKLLSEFETRNDWHTANLWLPDLPTWKTTCKGKCSSYMVYKTECSSCNTHACRSCTTMASFTSVPHATHMQIMYYDGQFNDSRMNVALACSSAAAGATVMNYTECKQLIKAFGVSALSTASSSSKHPRIGHDGAVPRGPRVPSHVHLRSSRLSIVGTGLLLMTSHVQQLRSSRLGIVGTGLSLMTSHVQQLRSSRLGIVGT
eukprot:1136615-Pelagomonas_calceolata.AAC.1